MYIYIYTYLYIYIYIRLYIDVLQGLREAPILVGRPNMGQFVLTQGADAGD